MKVALVAMALLSVCTVASADDCESIREIKRLLESSPDALSKGMDASMNEDRAPDDFYYFVPAIVLSGAARCSLFTDEHHDSLEDAQDITYRCSWEKADGEGAIAEAETMAAAYGACVGIEQRTRKYDTARSSRIRHFFFEDVQTWRGAARYRSTVGTTFNKVRGTGDIVLSMSVVYGDGPSDDE